MKDIGLFTYATLAPALLIGLAVVFGGLWAWAAVGYLTVFIFGLDRLVARHAGNADPEAEFPAAQSLLVTLGLLHFVVLTLSLWAIAGQSGLSTLEKILIGFAAGLSFGQISHPVAHELIHQNSRFSRWLGRAIYSSLLVGHHASAHLRVHHVHVGSDEDPNTARPGEGFYRFALRASHQSFMAGLAAENKLRAGRTLWRVSHPFVAYIAMGAATAGAVLALGGLKGLAAFLALALYAQMQILLSDYVQHYGLRRGTMPNGRLEPVGPQHSWNAPHWFSSALMVNAPRHSDHHVTPNRPFPALQLDADAMPMLPYPIPIMAVIALMPRLWRRVMEKRCGKWRRHAASDPLPEQGSPA